MAAGAGVRAVAGRRTNKPVWIAAAACAGLLATAWLARERPIVVRATAVERRPLVVTVVTNGTVEPARETEVRAGLDGRVLFVVEEGTKVAPGEVLVRIDARRVEAELKEARSRRIEAVARLEQAKDAVEQARERVRVDRELLEAGALAPEAYRLSERALAEAESRYQNLQRQIPLELESLDLRIEDLQARLEAARVRASFAGTVYRRQVEQGQVVRAGDPLLWVADLGHLRVRANVDQVDLGRVREGQEAVIRSDALGRRAVPARVARVIPHVKKIESRSVSEALLELIQAPEGLVPGMIVDVEIIVERISDALQIPAEAVFVEEGRSYAYRVVGNRLGRVAIETGRASALDVEVLSGLKPGDRVVLSPREGLSDGMRVQVEAVETSAGS
ncbi:MAG: efflux RND transporter periplasmic adaptor subunit [Candidatus Dadabacteria bacterium]|nr:MAG: efflux RND transporter periplasmic adaptor subunit [Candidatus Dadabacteria bacterium]